jgi:hypothetical protein
VDEDVGDDIFPCIDMLLRVELALRIVHSNDRVSPG